MWPFFTGKGGKKKGEKPPKKYIEIEFLPLELWEANMINALLEGLQDISGRIVTSAPVIRLSGVFFVLACLLSALAFLVTALYLASPKGFEQRLARVLVERPVTEEKAGAVEQVTKEEEPEAVKVAE